MEIILPILLTLSLMFGRFDYTKTEEFQRIIANVESWRELVEEVKEFNDREVPVDLALAVIAQESLGNNNLVSTDGHNTVCIFQVRAASWMSVTSDELKNPVTCAEWGLFFLEHGLEICEGNEYCALRVYNCGPDKAFNTSCGQYYSDRVQNFWRPYFSRQPAHQEMFCRKMRKRFDGRRIQGAALIGNIERDCCL